MTQQTETDRRDEALEAVRTATDARSAADAAASAARDEQSAAIRNAIAAGVPVSAIQTLTGFSHARVYQIRDGRR